jgi:hypothetical protein
MGIRETLNRQKSIGLAVGVLLVVGAIGLFVTRYQGSGGHADLSAQKVFYTTDLSSADNALKAMFADRADRYPPFDHNGKEAVRVRVWTADDGKTRYISHFERFTPEAKERIRKMVDGLRQRGVDEATFGHFVTEDVSLNGGVEYRFPESDRWIPREQIGGQLASRIMKNPNATPSEVLP